LIDRSDHGILTVVAWSGAATKLGLFFLLQERAKSWSAIFIIAMFCSSQRSTILAKKTKKTKGLEESAGRERRAALLPTWRLFAVVGGSKTERASEGHGRSIA
jgi:hypothetical protein